MQVLTSYIIKVILISAIMYGYYLVSLRNKKFHVYNRFYLLSATFLPLILPLVKLDFLFSPENTSIPVILQNDIVLETIVIRMNGNFWSWEKIIYGLYFLVALSLIFLFIASLWRIYVIKHKGTIIERNDCVLIESKTKGTPFSFFKFIFWNPQIDFNSHEGKQIFSHELAHVHQLHSLDKLIVNVVQIIFWFNPVFWLIKREINIVHEFLADKESIEDADAHSFSKMALQAAYPGFTWPATNSFFYSPLKRRLVMLLKNKHQRVTYIGRLMVLPLLAGLFLFFTSKVQTVKAEDNQPVSITDTVPHNPDLKSLRVYSTDGKEPIVNVEWNNGKKETLTIKEAKAKGIVIPPPPPPPPPPPSRNSSVIPPPPPPPPQPDLKMDKALIIMDGKVLDKSDNNEILFNNAHSVTYLKGKDAILKYGERAKDGAVEFNTIDSPLKIHKVSGGSDKGIIVESATLSPVDDTIPQDDRVFVKVEQEASFPGGPSAWRMYIVKKVQEELKQFTDKDYGTCVVRFVVDKDGNISDVQATTMKGTKLAELSVNAIRKGPRWIPAKNNGISVNAYRLQPVTLSKPGK